MTKEMLGFSEALAIICYCFDCCSTYQCTQVVFPPTLLAFLAADTPTEDLPQSSCSQLHTDMLPLHEVYCRLL